MSLRTPEQFVREMLKPNTYYKLEEMIRIRDAEHEAALAAARARLDEVLRLGREMRERQVDCDVAAQQFAKNLISTEQFADIVKDKNIAEAAFDAALSPGDNAAGS